MSRAHRKLVTLLLALAVPLAAALAAPAPAPPPPTRPRVEPAAHRSYTETLPESRVRFDLVAVPGGVFWRGSFPGERGRAGDEGPRHPVCIRPFWMGRTEVTWDEFDQYLWHRPEQRPPGQRPLNPDADAVTRPSPSYIDETFGYGRAGYPVLGISHHAAMAYCRWLSRATGKLYRLPTEAEWEWAARAGTTTAYFFGDDAKKLGDYTWFADNSDEATHPVGRKKPNPWGLYDMYGNVSEWCLDHYRPDAYAAFPTDRLTLAPVSLPTADRFPDVVRGGSWADGADRCRSAAREASRPAWNRIDPMRPRSIWWLANGDFVGFRVVRALGEKDDLADVESKVTPKSK
jgi:formylglycine-generating enzyme required for sulfatase activity